VLKITDYINIAMEIDYLTQIINSHQANVDLICEILYIFNLHSTTHEQMYTNHLLPLKSTIYLLAHRGHMCATGPRVNKYKTKSETEFQINKIRYTRELIYSDYNHMGKMFCNLCLWEEN